MLRTVAPILHALLLIIFIGTWSSVIYYIQKEPSVNESTVAVTPAAISTQMPVPASNVPTAVETIPEPDWSSARPGLEKRVIEIYDGQNQHVESLHVWRLDQNYFRLDVAYDETPKSLETWQEETKAALVVNGGYYSIENERYSPDGLTIVNGDAVGRSSRTFEGMLAITSSRAELRSLAEKPYNALEPLHAALQSFPILVKPGGQLGFPARREAYARARRTVIGQDRDGRILFILAPQGYFTLHQLSVYLIQSDLNLDIAVNLDGGGSTGILVANPRDTIPPTRPLPFVILAYPR